MKTLTLGKLLGLPNFHHFYQLLSKVTDVDIDISMNISTNLHVDNYTNVDILKTELSGIIPTIISYSDIYKQCAL